MDKRNGILKHYVKRFNTMLFDEYDVMGFLILIRNQELKEYSPVLYDFSNIVAHRDRTKGIVFNAMNSAFKYGYKLNLKGKVTGFTSPSIQSVISEIKQIADQYMITATKDFIMEFILCLMSIGQHVVCEENQRFLCKLELMQGADNTLALIAMGSEASVCYLHYNYKVDFKQTYSAGWIRDAIEMIRVNGKLEAHFCENGELA